MAHGGSWSRKTALTFLIGSSLGFCTTYLFVVFQGTDYAHGPLSNKHIISQQFIPDSPHSHGETNNFVGPEAEQHWNDFDAENHKRKFTVIAIFWHFN